MDDFIDILARPVPVSVTFRNYVIALLIVGLLIWSLTTILWRHRVSWVHAQYILTNKVTYFFPERLKNLCIPLLDELYCLSAKHLNAVLSADVDIPPVHMRQVAMNVHVRRHTISAYMDSDEEFVVKMVVDAKTAFSVRAFSTTFDTIVSLFAQSHFSPPSPSTQNASISTHPTSNQLSWKWYHFFIKPRATRSKPETFVQMETIQQTASIRRPTLTSPSDSTGGGGVGGLFNDPDGSRRYEKGKASVQVKVHRQESQADESGEDGEGKTYVVVVFEVGGTVVSACILEMTSGAVVSHSRELVKVSQGMWVEVQEIFGTSVTTSTTSLASQVDMTDTPLHHPDSPILNDMNEHGDRKDEGDEKRDDLCVICLSDPAKVIVLPCRHACLCQDCWLTPPEGDRDTRQRGHNPVNTERNDRQNERDEEREEEEEAESRGRGLETGRILSRVVTCPVCRGSVKAWVLMDESV